MCGGGEEGGGTVGEGRGGGGGKGLALLNRVPAARLQDAQGERGFPKSKAISTGVPRSHETEHHPRTTTGPYAYAYCRVLGRGPLGPLGF